MSAKQALFTSPGMSTLWQNTGGVKKIDFYSLIPALLKLDSWNLVHRTRLTQSIRILSQKFKIWKMSVQKRPIKILKIRKKMRRPRKKDTLKGFEDMWLKVVSLPNLMLNSLNFRFILTFVNCKCYKFGDKNSKTWKKPKLWLFNLNFWGIRCYNL